MTTYTETEPCSECGSKMCAFSSTSDICMHTNRRRKFLEAPAIEAPAPDRSVMLAFFAGERQEKSLDDPVADKQIRRPHRKKAVEA